MKKERFIFLFLMIVGMFFLILSISFGVFAEEKMLFGMVPKTLDNPAFAIAKTGAEDRAAELGDVEVYTIAPNTPIASEQVVVIESLIQRGVNGLLINSTGPAVTEVVNKAMEKGIPTITWDSDAPDSKRICYVGSDDYKGGLAAAELLKEATQGKGHLKIAILTGVPGVYNLGQRDLGFIDGMKGADAEIVLTVPCYDDLAKAVEAVENTIRGNPEINAWFFDGPWPLLVNPESLPNLANGVKSEKITVVSYDTLPQQLQWVKEEIVYGLVGQKYYSWGYQGVSVLYNIIKNNKQYPDFVDLGVDIVTKAGGEGRYTVEEFEKMWEEFKFKEEPM